MLERMIEEKDLHRYDDIINLPNPTSRRHPRMSLQERAAQFSPFSALTGHDAAIQETARLTEEKQELSEDRKASLNDKLQLIRENLDKDIPVAITYFRPDERKAGGKYVTHTGAVKRVAEAERSLIMADGTVIPLEQVSGMESDLFR